MGEIDLKINLKKGKTKELNKLLFHPSFHKTVDELGKLGLVLPPTQQNISLQLEAYKFPENGELRVDQLEIKEITLSAHDGQSMLKNFTIAAYDESVNRYDALEGSAYLTSHSLVLLGIEDFVPLNFLTLYFYTRSESFAAKYPHMKHCQDPEVESKRDYVNDKIEFLQENAPPNSLLFIDGPLIGGNLTSYTLKVIDSLLAKGIIPVFFVKNSTSSLVRDNIEKIRSAYNSDLHWAFKFLKAGQRTNFIPYVDKYNPKNAKMFCYLKAHNVSPQRIEFDKKTYKKYEAVLPKIMDLVYYLLLVQGDKKNPQIRPIAIAEKFARETIHLLDLSSIMMNTGLTPTMNQERFAW